MKVIPVNDRLLIQPIEESEVTPGGIYKPETSLSRPWRGTVIDLGPDRDGHRYKVGDVVVFSQHAGTTIKHPDLGFNALILGPKDVLALLQDDEGEDDGSSASS